MISLDFELHWGMRDHTGPGSAAYAELAGSRRAVVELADLFAERGIRATWATVGFLFASTGAELTAARPAVRPAYRRPEFDPYVEVVGEDEAADPEHLAGSLVHRLASTAGQEVASHTFSHYYCLEDGQDEAAFRADLAAAQSIALHHDLALSSLVLPRNQWNPRYARAVLDSGFTCIRGPQPSWGHQARPSGAHGSLSRMMRLADTYVGVSAVPTFAWDSIRRHDGLCDVPASAFLRPFSPSRRRLEPLRMRRLVSGLRAAATGGRIVHLWWHPHNFARHPEESFAFLNRLLDEFDRLADRDGMRSMAMRDVVESIDQPVGPGVADGPDEAMIKGQILGDSQL